MKIFIKTASLITLLLIGSCGWIYYSIQPIDEQTNTRTARNYFEKLTNLSCEEVGDISIKSTQQFRDPVYYLYFKNTNMELLNKIVKLNELIEDFGPQGGLSDIPSWLPEPLANPTWSLENHHKKFPYKRYSKTVGTGYKLNLFFHENSNDAFIIQWWF